MLDRERILARLDELEGYQRELREIAPRSRRSTRESKSCRAGLISASTRETLQRMKAFRNILVHEYGRVDDAAVCGFLRTRLGDFQAFRREILDALRRL